MAILRVNDSGRNSRQFNSAKNRGNYPPRLPPPGKSGRNFPFNYIPLTMHFLAKVRS